MRAGWAARFAFFRKACLQGGTPTSTPPIFEAKFVVTKELRGGCFSKFLILKSRFSQRLQTIEVRSVLPCPSGDFDAFLQVKSGP